MASPVELVLSPLAVVPMHTYPHEQTGYFVSGRLRLQIEDDIRDLSPGDCWMIPGGVPHEATALENSMIIEVFHRRAKTTAKRR